MKMYNFLTYCLLCFLYSILCSIYLYHEIWIGFSITFIVTVYLVYFIYKMFKEDYDGFLHKNDKQI